MDLSVVIPTHNAAAFLPHAIDSVLQQSMPCREIIIVDDGSVDDTAQVASSYENRVIYVSQSNRGPGIARNVGAGHATGRYLCFLDSDDTLATNMIEKLDRLRTTHSDPDMILYSAETCGEPRSAQRNRHYYRRETTGVVSGESFLLGTLQTGKHLPSPCLYVFKREILKIPVPLSFNAHLNEDEAFTPELIVRSERVIATDARLYRRRYRTHSITNSSPTLRNVAGCLVASDWWHSYSTSTQVPQAREYALRLYRRATRHAVEIDMGHNAFGRAVSEYCPTSTATAISDYISIERSMRRKTVVMRFKTRIGQLFT